MGQPFFMELWLKKGTVLLAFMILFSSAVMAQGLKVFVEPVTSYNRDCTVDYLYSTDGSLKSQLDWNALYLFKAGAALTLKGEHFCFETVLLSCLPFGCGTMYDSDWYTTGLKTNLSEHKLICAWGADCEFLFSYDFMLPHNFTLRPIVMLSDSVKKLHGQNGTGWCGDTNHTGLDHNVAWNDSAARQVKKYGVDFTNNVASLFLGLGVKKELGKFALDFSALISPLSYVLSVDHHLNSGDGHFYQMEQFIFPCDFRLSTSYAFTSKSSLKLSAACSLCPQTSGKIYFGWFGYETEEAPGYSAVSFSRLRVAVSWKYKIK